MDKQFVELARRGGELLKTVTSNETTDIARPANEDLSGISTAIHLAFSTIGDKAAVICKELIVVAYAMGYRKGQADSVPIDDVWKG